MRGRLINPFKVTIARLDTTSTAADPDAGGPLTSGYDSTFRAPLPKVGGGDYRAELADIVVPCQFENDDAYERLGQTAAGNDTDTRLRCVFHFQDLEELDLVDLTTGEAKFRIGDRLKSVHRYEDGSLIQRMGLDGGGFFCTEVKPVSFGLSGGERNLLVCTYEARDNTFKGG